MKNKYQLITLPLPFTKYPTKIYSMGLDKLTVLVYGYLASVTEEFYPSLDNISHTLRIGKTQAKRCLDELVNRNIIRKLPLIPGIKGRQRNRYEFVHPDNWLK